MKLKDFLEKQDNQLEEIRITLVKQEQNLKSHMRRTRLLEENVALLRREFNPIKTHVAVVNGITKAFFGFLTIVGTGAAIAKVFFM